MILKSKNAKTQELVSLPPLKPSAAFKHSQTTAVEARHLAATYALFRISSMKNVHMMLPPHYRDLWKGEFQQLKDEDVRDGKAWMYEADPFTAQKERDEARAQAIKKREVRQKQEELAASKPGGAQNGSGRSTHSLKGWQTVPKVDMGTKARTAVEEAIKTSAMWNPTSIRMTQTARSRVIAELSALGFRCSHVEEASDICQDREETLEWLLIHVPEDDLPAWCLPENYSTGVQMVSSNMQKESAIKRLAIGGYSREVCGKAYDASGPNEAVAAQNLQDSLLGTMEPVSTSSKLPTNGHTDNDAWDEEQEVLSSIYSDKHERVATDLCRIRLECSSLDGSAYISIRRPQRPYPDTPPVISLDARLPAYIRLVVTKRAVQHALLEWIGTQMIFNLVDWIENNIVEIIERPGRLAEISSVSSSASATTPTIANSAYVNRKPRHPTSLQHTVGSPASLKALAEWQNKRADPKLQKMIEGRRKLPAWSLQESIISAVKQNQIVIISGETGSGKSTQSVQFILDDLIQSKLGDATNIICTQPRRISALGLADRVSDERCSRVGEEVGYAIRGESKHGPSTKITFVTTGVLLRRLQTSGGSRSDLVASLADVSHIVLDEVHERDLNTDFLLALLRDVLKARKDLKLILMSATLDAQVFEEYFGGPRFVGKVEIQGRAYPVEDQYLDDVARLTNTAGLDTDDSGDTASLGRSMRAIGFGTNFDLIADLVRRIDQDLSGTDGGILIFLSGTVEIRRALDALKRIPNLHALPLHASLLPAEQRRVFAPPPPGRRKVICATNVAETSITIPDIVAVIDSGRVKETRFDPVSKMVKLEEVWVSLAAAKQRRGRAGRVQAGKCYKLYTRNAESKMADRPEPEIRRTPLEQLCLSVKAMGVDDVPGFLRSTLTPPESVAVDTAIDLLRKMGALNGDTLTALGRHLSMIPADLRCAKLLVFGALFDQLEPCLTVAAILSVKSPFVSPQEKREESKAARTSFGDDQGDVVADMIAYERWATMRFAVPRGEIRSWCDENFLSSSTLQDIASTRAQYLSSLKEIGFIMPGYNATYVDPMDMPRALLRALVLAALYPQTLRISYPPQRYQSTVSGALAVDPESREIKYFDNDNNRVFIHPSSTLFSAQGFRNNAGFMSYFNKVETSKVFVRELTPSGSYGMLLFGGKIELDTQGRGLTVDGWVRLRGWARIGVLVGRLRGILDAILERWVEEPGSQPTIEERKVIGIVRRLVELDGMDR